MTPRARSKPFSVTERDGIVTLAMSTPDSAVNIFDQDAAAQLAENVSRAIARRARLLVLRSSKPGSFVNGASLMVSNAAGTIAQVKRASRPLRAAFAALAKAPLPSVAVIEGNCFGCGLELAICCRYRIAKNIAPVRFWMTELGDYRLIPIFGATARLPRLIGPQPAASLLLDGEVWDAHTAHAHGLVDLVLEPDELEEGVQAFFARAVGGGVQRPSPGRAPLRRSLASVPPSRRGLWRECVGLINRSMREPERAALDAEVELSAKTVVSPEAKRAGAFFFVRQMALAASWGTAELEVPDRALRVRARSRNLAPLARLLREHPIGVPTTEHIDIFPERPHARGVLARIGSVPGVGANRGDALLYFPDDLLRTGFCEIVLGMHGDTHMVHSLARCLRWYGIDSVLTRPPVEPVSHRLLKGYALALQDMLGAGLTPANVIASLWQQGFARRPDAVLAALSNRAPAQRLRRAFARPGQRGRPHKAVIPILYATLITEIVRCLDDGSLTHAAQGDALTSWLLDFPRERGSLLLDADGWGLARVFASARSAGWSGDLPPSLEERLARGSGFYHAARAEAVPPPRARAAPVVVVAGANGELGRSVVGELQRRGFSVIATDMQRTGYASPYLRMDIRDEASLKRARDTVLGHFNRIDALVNCAGYFTTGSLLSANERTLTRTFDVNLIGALRCLRIFAAAMARTGGGRIIEIGSLAGRHGLAGASAYSAAKGGLAALTRAAAVELAPLGISIVCVVPGFIESAMTRAHIGENEERWIARIPAGRLGRREEVAELIAYLLERRSAYVTGTEVVIDGGLDVA